MVEREYQLYLHLNGDVDPWSKPVKATSAVHAIQVHRKSDSNLGNRPVRIVKVIQTGELIECVIDSATGMYRRAG